MPLTVQSLSFLSCVFAFCLLVQSGHCIDEAERARLIEEYNAEFSPTPPAAPPPAPPPGHPGEPPPPPPPPPPPVVTKKNHRQQKDRFAKEIRKKRKNWVVGINPMFDNVSDTTGLLGGKFVPVRPPPPPPPPPGVGAAPPKPEVLRLPPKRGGGNYSYYEDDLGTQRSKRGTLPAFYDLRTDYPECTSITSIRSQRGCGGCYAFAAASAMSDRHCIYNYRKTGQIFISTFHLLQCVPDGCNGGIEWDAMAYWKKKGLVTGSAGDVGVYQPDGCLPLPTDPSRAPKGCPTTCSNTRYSKTFEQDKTYGGSSGIKWFPGVEWIQEQIYKFGPVVAFLSVYEDFMYYYRGGVYDFVSGNKLGPHTVKLIGWGTEGGVDYWLAVNSWGTGWGGQNGLFKIRRGANTCQIEARISWALPKEAVPT